MDITKVKAAIAKTREELNKTIDAQFKAKQVNGLRTLTLADNALTLAEKHLDRAVEQATRDAAEVAEPVGAGAPAANAKK